MQCKNIEECLETIKDTKSQYLNQWSHIKFMPAELVQYSCLGL